MKICCSQEHYDKVVQYAKSYSITTMRLIRSDSANVIRTGIQALSEDCCIMEIRTSPLPSPWNVSTDGAYIPDIYATVCIGEPHAIWGSLFLCRRHDDSILISCATPARRPCRAGCLEKNHPRFAPVFFSAKPCRDAGKQTTGTTRNKNACTLQADNV